MEQVSSSDSKEQSLTSAGGPRGKGILGAALALAILVPVWWQAANLHPLLAQRGIGLAIVAPLVVLVYLAVGRRARLRLALKQRTAEFQRIVAESQRLEEALRASQARFAGIVEISDDAIISIDGTQRIRLFNPGAEKVFGYRTEEVLGKPLDMLLPPRFVAAHGEHVRSFSESPDALRPMHQRGTVFGLRKDGTEFPGEASISKFEVAGEKVMTVRLRDITERRRLEAQVRQAQKMEAIGTLAGGIAHDFNNILGAIIGYTEQALLEVQSGSRLRQHLEEVLAAGKRAKNLVRQILAFSRQTEQEREPILPQRVVLEVLKLLRATLPATIEIRQEIDADPGLILADPTQLHQVLMNLCTNAEHAMRGTGGVLEIALRALEIGADFSARHPEIPPGPYTKLSVRDTGHGMEREILDRIFDPFFTTKGVGEGTGMGLAVVHGIVTSLGGAILVESAPGRGTCFDVYLPRTGVAAVSEGSGDEPVYHGAARILFVDDEEPLARLGAEMLRGLGYDVVASTSSTEALERFRKDPEAFDLVITDQTMPGMSGESLARELLRLRPNLPIIQCTGFSHTMSADKAKAMGIKEYLLKPVGRHELGAVVQRVLRERAGREPRSGSP
jgi:PAS domain S-box-containing protein